MHDALPSHLIPAEPGSTALVLADGEHYPQVVADTVADLGSAGWSIGAVVLVGGSEKLRDDPDYGPGIEVVRGDSPVDAVVRGIERLRPSTVIDVSDEPVLVFEERTRIIATVAGMGVDYLGADAAIHAPRFADVSVPSLAVIGTGKRIGKTAISAHLARLADRALGGAGDVVVVAMGRGGPPEPVVIEHAGGRVGVERLLEISRAGAHAASDYLEDAALTGLTTIGCRRAGGGLLGAPVQSNVVDGARLAEAMQPRLVVFEGSGSCLPPVKTDRTVLLASTARPGDLLDHFGRYRLARADLVLVVGDDRAVAADMCGRVELLRAGRRAIAVSLTPTPVSDISGRNVAMFTTAPASAGPVFMRRAAELGAELVLLSHELARRDTLRADVAAAVERGADCFVVEIKAAGIDVVAEAAAQHGIDVVFLDNPPVPHDSSIDLDSVLAQVALDAAAR
jgi:cyclic 2,3-diphosphoglycerate synthetase